MGRECPHMALPVPAMAAGVLQQLLLQNPDPHFVQSDRRDGFLDLRVFGGGTGFGGLEQVVQAGEFIDFEVLVARLYQCLPDRHLAP